jgi:hypothetical protein
MENQINAGDQITQQIGQNSVSQSVKAKKKSKINYWMISTVVLFVALIAGVGWFILDGKNKTSSQQLSTKIQGNQTVVTGIIRTSGLIDEEKQRFGFTNVSYQITDFEDYQKGYQEGQVMGYYLLSNNISEV